MSTTAAEFASLTQTTSVGFVRRPFPPLRLRRIALPPRVCQSSVTPALALTASHTRLSPGLARSSLPPRRPQSFEVHRELNEAPSPIDATAPSAAQSAEAVRVARTKNPSVRSHHSTRHFAPLPAASSVSREVRLTAVPLASRRPSRRGLRPSTASAPCACTRISATSALRSSAMRTTSPLPLPPAGGSVPERSSLPRTALQWRRRRQLRGRRGGRTVLRRRPEGARTGCLRVR